MALDTDVRIARQARMRPILEIAAELGLPASLVELHGPHKAKIRLEALSELGPPRAKIVVVTAMTPTPLGEGRTRVGESRSLGCLGPVCGRHLEPT